jgi:plasmid stabilization system protein ParE
MPNDLVLLPEALSDAAEAYAWYEERSAGLGERFLKHVDECLEWIRDNPQLFEVVYKNYRRAIVKRFPYVIFYKINADVVTVYSIFHTAQHPAKWRKRLESRE